MENNGNTYQRVTNLDYLVELSKGNNNFVKEMIGIFLSENSGELAEFEKSIREKDYDAIKALAHKLRSTIPYIGLDKLIEKEVTEIENLAAKKSYIQKIESMFFKIKEICERARHELMHKYTTVY
jgi:HPt (histidine-containing phosphotransfer) domain-containing protein